MARTEIRSHRKFKQLARWMESIPLALGTLECMWHSCYESCTDYLGQAEDVELACEWNGPDGELAKMLLQIGWVDEVEGRYFAHDFWDHCPEYIKLRLTRRGYGPRVTRNKDLQSETSTNEHERGAEPAPSATNETQTCSNVASTQHNTTQQDKTEQKKPQPTARPIPKKGQAEVETTGFLAFWSAWPSHHRKGDKKKCLAKWQSDGLEANHEAVVASVVAWKQSEDWTKSGGNFIPAPLVWLNRGAWEAPHPPPATNKPGPSSDDLWKPTVTGDAARKLMNDLFGEDNNAAA